MHNNANYSRREMACIIGHYYQSYCNYDVLYYSKPCYACTMHAPYSKHD